MHWTIYAYILTTLKLCVGGIRKQNECEYLAKLTGKYFDLLKEAQVAKDLKVDHCLNVFTCLSVRLIKAQF